LRFAVVRTVALIRRPGALEEEEEEEEEEEGTSWVS
jgi:hypothetical protein